MLDNSGLLAWVANVAILISMITVIISGQHFVKMKRFFEILFRCLFFHYHLSLILLFDILNKF